MLQGKAEKREGRGQVGMEEGAWCGRAWAVGTHLPPRVIAARQRSVSSAAHTYQ